MNKSQIKMFANNLCDAFIADNSAFDNKINELSKENITTHEGFMIGSLAQLYYNVKAGIITNMEYVKEKQKQILKGEM